MNRWESAKNYFADPAEWLDGGLAIVSGILDVCSRILAKERNVKEAECRKRVEEAEARIEGHPISAMVWAAERERRMGEWDKIQQDKQKRWAGLLREKGIECHDQITKETFQKLQPRRTQQQTVELRHPFDCNAPNAATATGMLHYAKLYYEDILTTRRPQEDPTTDLSTDSDMWEDTKVTLSDTARLDLDRPVSLEELTQTVKSMAKGKSPGIDGLSVEFYIAAWGTIGPKLVELYNQILVGGRLGKGITHGVISMLFKKGDKSEVRNWRPISLLIVPYKILAKTLARRLGRYLPDLVEGDQGAFVQGRSIFNNIVTALEVLEWVQSENMDTAILLLDLEKAYDKVGWPFVFTTLRRMGFGTSFCKWTVAMYTLSTSAVMINGHLSAPFNLTRSLRQGCPLAPFLFVVLLNRLRRNPRIKGLTLHSATQCKVKALADDLFVISENSNESLSSLKDTLTEYSVLSEASVNWNKSVFLLPAQFELSVQWGMKRISEGEEERFLGVLVSLHIEASTQVREVSSNVWRTIKSLVARFIWKPKTKEGEGCLIKVAWELLTFPRCEGGLNLVEPVSKNQAQLSMWLARVANAAEKEHWMELAEQILMKEWDLSRPQDVWSCLFIHSFQRKRVKSRFWREVLKAWSKLPPDGRTQPVTKEEVKDQILFENPQIVTEQGSWFKADGSTASFGLAWIRKGVVTVRDLWDSMLGTWRPRADILGKFSPLRNVELHWIQLLKAIPDEWCRILGPDGIDPEGTWYCPESEESEEIWKLMEVFPSGFRKVHKWQCQRHSKELSCISEAVIQIWENPPQARVVDRRRTPRARAKWVWVGHVPLQKLRIDPEAWSWTTSETRSLTEYSVAKSYNLRWKKNTTRTPADVAIKRWQAVFAEDLSEEKLSFHDLWKMLPLLPNGKQASILWQISLMVTPSAVWLTSRGMQVELKCSRCSWPFESTRHLWWECPTSKRIWRWWKHHWQHFGDPVVDWEEKWVLFGFLPEGSYNNRGWAYIAQVARGLLCEIIWRDRNRARFEKRPFSDLEIKRAVRQGLREAIKVDWRKRAKAGKGSRRQLQWFLDTWANRHQLAGIHKTKGLVFSPWITEWVEDGRV
ncbi:hypothetical protein CBR_g8604 [Chara braunii]|uniref:Reverse transcriptase domain-containing protein n=1 Tax=Chara braunii TaxID=69332 RepID=A0A388JS90_CHABU|nr:hypothetical protein CBR_g8604 [Chara braunii]|eukprot:GBG60582.1 hypothetical protein CBR_g8604 [Chara braunii]